MFSHNPTSCFTNHPISKLKIVLLVEMVLWQLSLAACKASHCWSATVTLSTTMVWDWSTDLGKLAGQTGQGQGMERLGQDENVSRKVGGLGPGVG